MTFTEESRKTPRSRDILLLVVLALVIVAYGIWSPGQIVEDGRNDLGQNGIWLQHGWLGDDAWFAPTRPILPSLGLAERLGLQYHGWAAQCINAGGQTQTEGLDRVQHDDPMLCSGSELRNLLAVDLEDHYVQIRTYAQ